MPVRPARPADRPALSSLQSHLPEPSPSLLAAACGGGSGDGGDAGVGGSGVGTLLVSTADGDPVGYLLAADTEGEGHVAELVVAPASRREGRASNLLASYLRTRPDGTRVTVTVAPENEGARALYEAHGFEVAGRRREFFESGDALVYERTA